MFLSIGLFIITLILLSAFPLDSHAAQDSVCARVKIEIRQELTLERQAFDAHMAINNGLTNIALQDVAVDVNFTDENGNPVLATSDPDNTEANFFIRVDTMDNINAVDGTGTVQPSTTADIHWLIIPAQGASNGLASGTLYYVGATLSYTMGGEQKTTEVTPDYIFVKPMPALTLDYFLPTDVYGDDAFTSEIEPIVPFSLGVRVKNSGAGTAKNIKIDSAQPKIVENELGLLINFAIEGSEVNGQPATDSLLVNFGDILTNESGTARWIMTCTLSGKFVDFKAEYSHSDELGGQLTSLIDAVNTHFLVRDVLVDLPGRDSIRDFLGKDGGIYRVYESDSVDSDVLDQSASSSLQPSGAEYILNAPMTAGFMYVQLPDPFSGQKILKEVIRSDGKRIKADNAWLSKTRFKSDPWQYFINIFDVNTTDSYRVVFEDVSSGPQPPVLQFIPDRTRAEGEQLSFIVEASDPNGTIPVLSASPLPAGAKITDQGNTGNGIATGIFDWTPVVGQAGRYEITFKASDGALEDTQKVIITINSAQDIDGDGIPGNVDNCPDVPNANQADTDYDGKGDACDECPNDANKIVPGICGCGVSDADTDNDGVKDCQDVCPDTPQGEQVNTEGCSTSQLNQPPIADAGFDITVITGEPVIMNGSESFDPEDEMITFFWTFVSVPAGSSLTDSALSDVTSAKPKFTPDIDGNYTLKLIVNDGEFDSIPDEIIITASTQNAAPNANAGNDQNALTSSIVQLNGSASNDPEGSGLAFIWTFVEVPVGSSVTADSLSDAASVQPSFTPDVAGIYRLRLIVNDSYQDSAPDEVVITASTQNAVPNANAGDDISVSINKIVVLDSLASNDPDNGPQSLAYSWIFVTVPTGSGITNDDLAQANTSSPSFVPDVAGTYVIRLTVSDGQNSDSDNVAVTIAFYHISGNGLNYPEPGFSASMSLDIRSSSLGTGWLKYNYNKRRLNLVSTSITELSINGKTVTIKGAGTVNGVPGYTFEVTIIDGDPDTMRIIIFNPNGTINFDSGTKSLSSGDFNVGTSAPQYKLTTSVTPTGAGSISPDCSVMCWYDSGTMAILTANENSGFSFIDWIGCDSASNNICTVTMNADKNVTASYSGLVCLEPARIAGTTPVYYPTFLEAYNASNADDIIEIQSISISGDLTIEKSVIIKGGFNCDYSAINGTTVLNGNMTISDGIVTIENVQIQ
jgi:hypothetical protein